METNYGTFMGDFQALRSVATLACMTKRVAFFSGETIAALKILANNHMTSQQMRGSWAGAMGNMQFMPSTFVKWAVDRDGNGKIDIWTSMPDAFASAANFLRGIGFKPGLPAADEVRLPPNFPLEQADMSVEKPVRAWAAMGVKRAGGAALPASDEPSSIILPAGWRGPAFILYPNFKAVMNWNRSTLYALAVTILAQQIAGGPAVMQPAPADDEPLSRNTVIDLQTRLARLGFYTDEADGLLGPKTRSAVRMFQKQIGMPADGHPTPQLVARLQQAVRSTVDGLMVCPGRSLATPTPVRIDAHARPICPPWPWSLARRSRESTGRMPTPSQGAPLSRPGQLHSRGIVRY